jgi:hypothetical protein
MAGLAEVAGAFWQAAANVSKGNEPKRTNFEWIKTDGILVPLPGIIVHFSVKHTAKFTTRNGHHQVEVEAIYSLRRGEAAFVTREISGS